MASCKSVLVVEDDQDLRGNIRSLLEMDGYKVLDASNGREALDVLAKLSPDLLPGCILLDYMMPVMDGKAFVETLARDHAETWAKISIILATAKGSMGSDLPVLPLVRETIRKPMDIDDLLRVVAKNCGNP